MRSGGEQPGIGERRLFALWLALIGCGPRVSYGTPAPMPLVGTSVDRERWYVVVDAGNLGERLFFLDTGYSASTCDDAFAAELGLRGRGRVWVIGESGRLTAKRARMPEFSLGGHTLRGASCLVRDLHATSSIQDPPEVPVAGVLGMDWLRPFVLHVDPQRAVVELRPSDPAAPVREDARLLREGLRGERPRIEITVNGAVLRPVLDTGAGATHLDGDARGLALERERLGVETSGTGGTVRRDLRIYRADLRVGPLHHPELLVIGRDDPWRNDGLLGLDVLRSTVQTYDFPAGAAAFEPLPADGGPYLAPSYRQFDARRRTVPRGASGEAAPAPAGAAAGGEAPAAGVERVPSAATAPGADAGPASGDPAPTP